MDFNEGITGIVISISTNITFHNAFMNQCLICSQTLMDSRHILMNENGTAENSSPTVAENLSRSSSVLLRTQDVISTVLFVLGKVGEGGRAARIPP